MPDTGIRKPIYKHSRIKAFIFEDGSHTSSWLKAVNRFHKGEKVTMYVHVSGYGQWETSEIEAMYFSKGKRTVETKGHFYRIDGKERPQRVKEIRFYVPGSSEQYLSSKVNRHLGRVLQYLQLGAQINTEVVYRDGSSRFTSEMVEFYPARRFITTAGYSIYKW